MPEFLERAGDRIGNLAGMKFTDPTLDEFQQCLAWRSGEGMHFWGVDQMFLAAWSVGARAAIGSSYNIAAPLYQRIAKAFESGDLETCRELQLRGIELIRLLSRCSFFSGLKAVLEREGIPMGSSRCRLPIGTMTDAERDAFLDAFDALDIAS